MFFITKDKTECCGCTACKHSCPVNAISFQLDDEGFSYPQIDYNICIHCGLCEKVCPFNHPRYENNSNPDAYASMIKNKTERVKSSSGGVFYKIASYIIAQKGIVYGAIMDDNFIVKHIGVSTIADLSSLRGSKYVQSELNDVFKQIKGQLDTGRLVYFVGTGCQVAGLKSFLRKKYPNLLTSDIVCHGVPSQKMFNMHLHYLEERYNAKIKEYSFRDYEKWQYVEKVTLLGDNGEEKNISNKGYALNPYIYAFMNNYISRYSCYDCKFARIPRQGDISLADYWGVQRVFPNINSTNGVSLVLINSEKGKEVWERICDDLESYETTMKDAATENSNLLKSPELPSLRKDIFGIINTKGYSYVVRNYFRPKNYFKLILKNYASNLCVIRQLKSISDLYKKRK